MDLPESRDRLSVQSVIDELGLYPLLAPASKLKLNIPNKPVDLSDGACHAPLFTQLDVSRSQRVLSRLREF
jgi:hypothetical protein